MIVNETKTKSISLKHAITFNLTNKKAGSILECPITIYKDGVELTQAQYYEANRYTGVTGTLFEIQYDFSKLIQSNYGGNVASFIADTAEMFINPAMYLYDYTLNDYQTTTTSSLATTANITKVISSVGILKGKVTSGSIASCYLQITINNNKLSTPSTIVADLQDNYSILLQGVHTPFETSSYATSYTRSLLRYSMVAPEYKLLDFNDGVIPAGSTTVGLGASLDSATFAGENVLKFGNSGQNSTTASIDIPVTTTSAGTLGIEFYISSESGYDKLKVYLDSSNVLVVSGTSGDASVSSNTYSYDSGTIKAGAWSKYYMTNVAAGNHTIRFEYVKDSSDARGLDNAFIRNIFTGGGTQTLELCIAKSYVYLYKNNSTLITSSSLGIAANAPCDILLSKTPTGLELKVLTANGTITTLSSATSTISGSNVTLSVLPMYGSIPANFLLDAMFVINKALTDTEKESIIRGTQAGFKRPKILTGAITPSASYTLTGTGTATLYINDGVSRTVTGSFTTSAYENNIVLDDTLECLRA